MRASALFTEKVMTETKMRREKVLVLKTIKCDNEVDGLDGSNPKKYKAGEVIFLPPIIYQHYARNRCVTKDLPIGSEEE
jgi:hypothetical protein